MRLQKLLESIEAEEEARQRGHDPVSLVERAKKRGLIQGPEGAGFVPVPAAATAATATELKGMVTRWVEVGPDLAARWLQHNRCNRRLRKDVVQGYARQMRRGEWQPLPEGICFNTNHDLVNGQHRLHAILESGATVLMMVTTGVPAVLKGSKVQAMDLMDTGAPRSVSDQLRISHGLEGGSIISAVVRSLVNLCQPERLRRLSVAEVLTVYQALKADIDTLITHRSKAPGLRQAGVMAAFLLAMQAPEQTIGLDEWQALMCGGDAGPVDSAPLRALHGLLTSESAVLLSRKNDLALAELTLQALYLHATGSLEVLTLTDAGSVWFRQQAVPLTTAIQTLFNPEARP